MRKIGVLFTTDFGTFDILVDEKGELFYRAREISYSRAVC